MAQRADSADSWRFIANALNAVVWSYPMGVIIETGSKIHLWVVGCWWCSRFSPYGLRYLQTSFLEIVPFGSPFGWLFGHMWLSENSVPLKHQLVQNGVNPPFSDICLMKGWLVQHMSNFTGEVKKLSFEPWLVRCNRLGLSLWDVPQAIPSYLLVLASCPFEPLLDVPGQWFAPHSPRNPWTFLQSSSGGRWSAGCGESFRSRCLALEKGNAGMALLVWCCSSTLDKVGQDGAPVR